MSKLADLTGWSKLPVKRKSAILLLLAILFSGIAIHAYFATFPDGKYDEPLMGCDCHLILKNGRIYQETEKSRDLIGTYLNFRGQWVYKNLNASNEQMVFKSSLFGITMINPEFQHGHEFCPRLCFSPVFNWMEMHWHIYD